MDVKRWSELKEAFNALVEREPDEQARELEAIASTDPELHRQLAALLAADARGESLQQIFESAPPLAADRPKVIGPYEITGVLGVGGMGEVYRAHDSRLRREVAIKVLPAAFAVDRDRLTRFEREAQVLASLNHPHVAHVYGLERSDGLPALVMELVQGETLAELIASAPVALARALVIARQIADGLDAAHEKGIIHRDLKPRNIALSESGDVKILDFGVAKILANDAISPADTLEATDAGAVLGTPAYMSPEQARGLAVDKRTDIWAFGCVLYELLTGRRPFAGATASDSIAAVLERDPDMTILPPTTPAPVRSLLRHCLEKDPKRRLRDIADARLTIDDLLSQPADERVAQPGSVRDNEPGRTTVRQRLVWLLVGGSLAASATAIVTLLITGRAPADDTRTILASVVLPSGLHLPRSSGDPVARFAESRFAVSPDGRRLALVAADASGQARLWLRDLASPGFQALPETDGASYPFWSPDSQFVAFVAAGKLKKIRASGASTPITLCDGGFRTGAWGGNDVIVFAPAGSSPLSRVSASGGEPTSVTTLDKANGEVQHSYPAFLPGGRHFMYFSVGSKEGAIAPRGVYVGSLDGTEPPRLLLPGITHARYASGHVLFLRSGTLLAQQLDLDRIELRGTAVPLIERVNVSATGTTAVTGAFSVSDNGVLAYETSSVIRSQPVWFDRAGRQLGALATKGDYGDVTLSPDGGSLALSVMDPAVSTRDLWLYDVANGRGRRFTFDAADDFAPVWSPDGKRVLYSSNRKGAVDLYVKDASGLGEEQPIRADTLGLGRFAADWSRDGRFVMYIGGGRIINRSDLWVVPLARPEKARALLDSTFVETHGRFAPDGNWFVYTSFDSGRQEVYVDRFPDRGTRDTVSTDGGGWARWSRGGKEIFYLASDNRLMSAAVKVISGRLVVSTPRALFPIQPRPPVRLDAYPYDVSPDGQRFLVNTLVEESTTNAITLVVNWTAALKN